MPVNFISSITDKGVKFDTESLTVGDAYLLSHKSDNETIDATFTCILVSADEDKLIFARWNNCISEYVWGNWSVVKNKGDGLIEKSCDKNMIGEYMDLIMIESRKENNNYNDYDRYIIYHMIPESIERVWEKVCKYVIRRIH